MSDDTPEQPAIKPSGYREEPVAQEIDWDDFRDHLTTSDQEGGRLWVYPKQPQGRFYQRRTWLSYLLLLILFVGPFVKINGNPFLMFNIVERKFSILGIPFWPQDMFLFSLMMLAVFIMIVLATAVYGRIWCGWLCPQTVLMEMVFRKIEYWIEGDYMEQRALNESPWTAAKCSRKMLKWTVFYVLSFVIGNLLLAYILGGDRWIALVTDDPGSHLRGLAAMILFSLMFFGIFARFREQACTFVCPYGRFQSVLLDEDSIIVGYDFKRGEKRGRLSRGQPLEERRGDGKGDCIDCQLCVSVCPTGIDIRNGLQMECVHCTACIDACDSVMDRIHRPKGLIRYASLNSIEKGAKYKIKPRLVVYSVLLCLLTGVIGFLLAGRSPIQVNLLRAPGALYQEMADGHITNLYLMKLQNRTNQDIPIALKLENVKGVITVAGNMQVEARQMSQSAVVVNLGPDRQAGRKQTVKIGVYLDGEKIEELETVFLAP